MPLPNAVLYRGQAWQREFLPKPDRVTQSSSLAGAAYSAVSGAAIASGFLGLARLVMTNDSYAFIGAAAPGNDNASTFVENIFPFCCTLQPGERLWVKRVGNSDRGGSCEVWLVPRS